MKKYMVLLAIALFCVPNIQVTAQPGRIVKGLVKGAITSGGTTLLSGRDPLNDAIKQAQSAASRQISVGIGTAQYVQPQTVIRPNTEAPMAQASPNVMKARVFAQETGLPSVAQFEKCSFSPSEAAAIRAMSGFPFANDSINWEYYRRLHENDAREVELRLPGWSAPTGSVIEGFGGNAPINMDSILKLKIID